jgi:hypothetical protein
LAGGGVCDMPSNEKWWKEKKRQLEEKGRGWIKIKR